ncbi:MAG: helicase-related protein, partial [Burkholderiales bacterium]
AHAIHGNKSQGARQQALESFKAGHTRVLVATDIAARGIDIDELPHVVNFDMPHVPEEYVHRIGRTGRAGSSGEAVSLVCHDDRPLMAAIEKLMNRKVELRVIAGFEPGKNQQQREPVQNRPRHQPRPHHQRRAENKSPSRPAQPPHRPHHAPAPLPGPVSRPTGTPAPAPRPKQSEQRRQGPIQYPRSVSGS